MRIRSGQRRTIRAAAARPDVGPPIQIGQAIPDDAAALLDAFPRVQGHLLSLFRTFANSTRFLAKGVPNLLDAASPLQLREREIVILLVTAHWRCEYEWGVHVTVFARAAGFTPEQTSATVDGTPDAVCWDARERTLLAEVDTLSRDGALSEPLLAAFRDGWTVEQQLDTRINPQF
ncbi:MAG: carboxymuconolactone decarboxylase family protein [Minwuia sp.]|nr:carboxymuconolactone decarboxylase family protein [Minwuia sp.]